jgi:uncharacterized protein (TIGR00288 family)
VSPWWSRPTADDAPEDDFEEVGDLWGSDAEEEASEPVEALEADAEEEGAGESRPGEGGRRRRRRRRSSRTTAETAEAPAAVAAPAEEEPPAEDTAAGDEEPSARTPARRRRRRSERSGAAESDERKSETKTKEAPRETAPPPEAARSPRPPATPPSKPAPVPAVREEPVRRAPEPVTREERPARRGAEPATSVATAVTLTEPAAPEVIPREIVVTLPERSQAAVGERKIALFCDLENIALGVRDSKEVNKFDIHLVLERLLEKGKIIVKKAYCDWERYSEYKRAFHEAAIELIDIPQKYYSGKNSADIKMVVDAMDLSYSKEHLDTFVLLSGDSDFSPLVSKLKENNKYVIGVGVKGASSNLLIDNCDEFLYYEDVWRGREHGPQLEGLSKKQSEVFNLLIDTIQALLRENTAVLWGSLIKQTMQRKKPSFNEGYYGYSTFSELLEDAALKGIVKIKKDQRSGSYIVTGFGTPAR